MTIRVAAGLKLVLLTGAALSLGACAGTSYTPAEQEIADTMGASRFQPRTQLEREAVETQDLFAQAAFWSREYDLNPGDLEAAMKLSSTLRKMGNPSQALEIAKTARALYPRDTNLISEYSANLIALERGKDAIAPLSTAARQDPNNARIWSLLGASHDQIGQFAKGREYYGRALSIAPNDPNVLANVGLSYALEGDARTAEIWLRRAANDPNAGAAVRQNLALVLGLQGKYDEAESLAREDLNADGAENNMAYMRSMRSGGRTYEALGKAQAAPQSSAPQMSAPRAQASVPSSNYTGRSQAPRRRAPQPRPSFGQMQQTPGQAYLPPTAPNVTPQAGGAREAALEAARRMQARGTNKRTIPVSPSQASAQQDVLSKIGQRVQPKTAPARPTYAQMQARAQQMTQQAQQQAAMEARQAQMLAQNQSRTQAPSGQQSGPQYRGQTQKQLPQTQGYPQQGYAPQGYPQARPNTQPGTYGQAAPYRAPARRRE